MRRRQQMGLVVGSVLGTGITVGIFSSGNERLRARGPMNPGHEDIRCAQCHADAAGSTRQQIQANVRYLLGQRATPVDFGLRDVGNAECLGCHERPNDRHPVFRFNEPRFAEARRSIAPHRCISCHAEHKGRRVSAEPTYCQHCHEDLKLSSDPLDTPHRELVSQQEWQTCLGCHDFHGNHLMQVPRVLDEAISVPRIEAYFKDSHSPYSPLRKHRAKREAQP